ncbi:MAG: DUF2089 domain-containing protein [Caldilineales bacterium]|nr:DUF2089 domain-containing protein [Caldilineales bacterium]
MNLLPTACPFCEGELLIHEIYCRGCDVTSRGVFTPGPVTEFDQTKLPVLRRFARLSPEQLALLEAFVRCEGKFNRLQEEVGLSYPTLRSRLNEMLHDLGFVPQEPEREPKADRRQILDALAAGEISADEAAAKLRGGQA